MHGDDRRHRPLGSLDIMELNPALDVRNRTAAVAVDLVASLFGKSTLMRQPAVAKRAACGRAEATAAARTRFELHNNPRGPLALAPRTVADTIATDAQSKEAAMAASLNDSPGMTPELPRQRGAGARIMARGQGGQCGCCMRWS